MNDLLKVTIGVEPRRPGNFVVEGEIDSPHVVIRDYIGPLATIPGDDAALGAQRVADWNSGRRRYAVVSELPA